MTRHSLLALALSLSSALASPVRRTPAPQQPVPTAAPTPIPTAAPRLFRRQESSEDDWVANAPEEGCTLTTFPADAYNQTQITEVDGTISTVTSLASLAESPGCLCAGGVIAGFYTDTASSGSQPIYCATGIENGASTPAGEPVSWITNTICAASKNAENWETFSMADYVSSQATELAPFETGFAAALEDQLEALSARGYQCEWSFSGAQGCDPGNVADVCQDDPKAAFAVMAIANFVNYLDDTFQTLQVVINTMTPTFATFVDTFNPNNITTMPGSSEAGITGTALYFAGSVAALVPGVNLVTGTTSKAVYGAIGAAAYMGGSGANVAGLGEGSGNIEVQFASFAAISGLLGDLAQSVGDSFSQFATDVLSNPPDEGFESDPRQLPSILASGAFAEPHPPFSTSMAQNLTAAIAGPGINLLWQYQGVVIAKVNKDNLPIDPCEGDNLFTADVKYCDADGNAFILQAQPEDPFGESITAEGMDDPEQYAVPGFDELSNYNLTVYDIVTSSWNNQQNYGPASSGPDAEDFINDLIEEQPDYVSRDRYINFNLYVCDYDEIPFDADDVVSTVGDDQCGDWTEENAQCWFYYYLAGGCPLQFAPEDGTDTAWPWGYKWIAADAECSGLVDTDGNPIGEEC